MSFIFFQDTDSLIFYLAEKNVRDCVLVDKLAEYDEVEPSIFEVKNANTVQHSRLKVEGVFKGGLFRSMKSYYLMPAIDDYLCHTCGQDDCGCTGQAEVEAAPVVRAKGLTRNVQKSMKAEHFQMRETDKPSKEESKRLGNKMSVYDALLKYYKKFFLLCRI